MGDFAGNYLLVKVITSHIQYAYKQCMYLLCCGLKPVESVRVISVYIMNTSTWSGSARRSAASVSQL